MTTRHKVFVSYHHANDQVYRDRFESLFANTHDVIVPKSVQIGDIDSNINADSIRQKIRDEYLRDSTVTVVLIGTQTWQRKHVDWEIGSTIRATQYNPRGGLLGIFLPTYSLSIDNKYTPCTIPPRLYKNVECGYAKLYKWSDNPEDVKRWVEIAFQTRNTVSPDNSYLSFVNNRTGPKWQ